jgi:Pyridoxamine 5'-phosphate oxidase
MICFPAETSGRKGVITYSAFLPQNDQKEFSMNEPATSTDPRFGDANATATPWEETRRMLETAELFWLSTVRADGRPHVTPLVAVWLDGAIHFSTGANEQKAVNLRGGICM